MAWIAASVFGLSWGVLLGWIDSRSSAWLPRICCAILFAVVAVYLIESGTVGASGLALVLGAFFGSALSAGVLWKGHPALEGLNYGERVRVMLVKGAVIRRHRGELPVHQPRVHAEDR